MIGATDTWRKDGKTLRKLRRICSWLPNYRRKTSEMGIMRAFVRNKRRRGVNSLQSLCKECRTTNLGVDGRCTSRH